MSTDGSLGFLLLAILAIGYLLPSIIVTLRGCRHAGLYWLLNITLGWSVMMWAYLLMRAILIDNENDDRYRSSRTSSEVFRSRWLRQHHHSGRDRLTSASHRCR